MSKAYEELNRELKKLIPASGLEGDLSGSDLLLRVGELRLDILRGSESLGIEELRRLDLGTRMLESYAKRVDYLQIIKEGRR